MRRYLPVGVLFVLAPLVGEVLLGATPVSRLGGLIPLSALYGGGAVVARELARRRGTGWGAVALLGAAYGLLEEGLGVQSLFNPTLFQAGELGGRALGVNGVWTEWTLGYHIVWSIAIPILLVELLFRDRRDSPWLGTIGTTAMGVLYLLGLLAIAAIFRKIVTPDFHTPFIASAAVAITSAFLVLIALRKPPSTPLRPVRTQSMPPSPWLVGLGAFVAAALWFGLLMLPGALRRGALVIVPMTLAIAMAAGLWLLVRRWSSQRGWTGVHSLALSGGAMTVSGMFGFFAVTAHNRIDHWGQAGVCVLALVFFVLFMNRLSRRTLVADDRNPTVSALIAGQ
jgi:hypothetical protein